VQHLEILPIVPSEKVIEKPKVEGEGEGEGDAEAEKE